MSDLVDAADIEKIVGAKRHPAVHIGRAVTAEQTVYILHSAECRDSGRDLRECPYSIALDKGIESFYPWTAWYHHHDRTTRLGIRRGYLVPIAYPALAARGA